MAEPMMKMTDWTKAGELKSRLESLRMAINSFEEIGTIMLKLPNSSIGFRVDAAALRAFLVNEAQCLKSELIALGVDPHA